MAAILLLFLLIFNASAAVTSVSLATTWFDAKNNSVTDTRVIGTREANVRHVIGRSSEGGFEIVLGGSGTYTIAKRNATANHSFRMHSGVIEWQQ